MDAGEEAGARAESDGYAQYARGSVDRLAQQPTLLAEPFELVEVVRSLVMGQPRYASDELDESPIGARVGPFDDAEDVVDEEEDDDEVDRGGRGEDASGKQPVR